MPRAADLRPFLLVAAVALAVSLPSVRNGFVYDDVPVLVEDTRIHTLADWPRLLTEPYWRADLRDKLYRPFTTVSFAASWAAAGGRPAAFHLANVLLHVLVAVLVLGLARRVTGPGPGLVAALWFAVHPVHVEVFANAVGRAELLAAAGYAGAVLAYLAEGRAAAVRPRGPRRVVLAMVTMGSAALAFGSKEHALTLPVVLLLADGWVSRESGVRLREVIDRHGITWGTVAGLAATYLLLRHAVLGSALGGGYAAPGLEGLGGVDRAVTMLPVVLVWLRLLAFPLHLSADYSPDVIVPVVALTWRHAAGAAALVAVVAAAWRWRRSHPALAAGVVWYAVTLAPTANVLVPTGVLTAERLLYLPSVGAALMVAAVWSMAAGRRWTWSVTALVLTLLAARSLERIPAWRDQTTFFTTRAHDAPASYRTYWQRGSEAFAAGDAATGERAYLNAVRIHPLDPDLLRELAERYLGLGRHGPADRYATASLALDSSQARSALVAMLARAAAGRAGPAAALADTVLRRFPDNEALALAAVRAYADAGAPRRAFAVARSLAVQHPGQWAYEVIAGDAAARVGRCDEARVRLERAVRSAPGEPALRERLASLTTSGACAR